MKSVLFLYREVITISAAATKVLIQLAIQVITDEETRKKVLAIALTPIISVVLILSMAYYILTNPIDFLSSLFGGDSISTSYAQALQDNYGYIGSDAVIDISGEYTESQTPLFIQWDKRWGNYSYGKSGTIGSSGCGPTSLAMVVVGLTGDTTVNPKVVADWSYANGHRVEGIGTAWSLFPAGARKWDIRCEELSVSASQISQKLREGKAVITSMGKGHFTNNGHFIVLRGITENGKILVNDPNSREKSKKEWSVSIIVSEAKGAWAFSKP